MSEGSWIRIGAVNAHLDATTVNNIIKDAIGKRGISITQKPELREDIGNALLEQVTPFVPESKKPTHGQLRASGRATDDGRLYWTAMNSRGDNYASYVYDQDCSRWAQGQTYAKPSTAGTHPRWVTQVTHNTQQWTAFVNNITPIIIRRFAEDE